MASRRYFRVLFFRLAHVIIIILAAEARAENRNKDDVQQTKEQLPEAPNGNSEAAEVAKIMKLLEAIQLASTTNVTTTSPTTTVSMNTTTTPKPSPFFNTKPPLNFVPPNTNRDSGMDDLIPFLEKQLEEVSQLIDEDPQWGNARPVREAKSSISRKTKTGRKASMLEGAIHDLNRRQDSHPTQKRRSASWGWDDGWHDWPSWGWDDHHHHHHVTYTKYQPEGLFRAFIRFLYKVVKPLALTKVRLKTALKRIKFQALWRIIRLLKTTKLKKVSAALHTLQEKLHIIKTRIRLRPGPVVLKEVGTVKAPPVKWGWATPVITPPLEGWGWGGDDWSPHTHTHSHWSPPTSSWSWSSPTYHWSPSDWSELSLHSSPSASHSEPPSSQKPGPPYGDGHQEMASYQKADADYHNHKGAASQATFFTAPVLPQASMSKLEPQRQHAESPSYVTYVTHEYEYIPSSLSDLDHNHNQNPGHGHGRNAESSRYLRQSEVLSESKEEELEVPYLIGNSTEERRK